MENNDKQLTNVKRKLCDYTSKEISEYLNSFPPKYQYNVDEYELRLKLIEIYLNRFPSGYKFDPSDDVLICDYLIPKIRGERLPINLMHDVSLYSHNPEFLAARCSRQGPKGWYFFTPRDKKYPNGTRPDRHAGDGYWKATGADKYIYRNDIHVGLRKALVFYKGRPPKGKKTPWIMHEFRTPDPPKVKTQKVKVKVKGKGKGKGKGKKRKFSSDDNDVDEVKDVCMRLGDSVLCRIYEKTTKASLANKLLADVEEEVEEDSEVSSEDKLVPPPFDVDNGDKEIDYMHPASYNNGGCIPSTDINHYQVDMYNISNNGLDNNQFNTYNANNNIGQNQFDMYNNTINNGGFNRNSSIDQNQVDMYINTINNGGDNNQVRVYSANNDIDHNRVNMYNMSNYMDYNHVSMYNRSFSNGGENANKYGTYNDVGPNQLGAGAGYDNYFAAQGTATMGGSFANQLGAGTGYDNYVAAQGTATMGGSFANQLVAGAGYDNYVAAQGTATMGGSFANQLVAGAGYDNYVAAQGTATMGGSFANQLGAGTGYDNYVAAQGTATMGGSFGNQLVAGAGYDNNVAAQGTSTMGGSFANQLGASTSFPSGVDLDLPSVCSYGELYQDNLSDTQGEPWSYMDEMDFTDCLSNNDFDDNNIDDPTYSLYPPSVPPNAGVFGMTSFDVSVDMVGPQGDPVMGTVEVKDEQPPLPPPHLPQTPRPSVR